MSLVNLSIFGVLLNVLISIASPYLTKKFGEQQAKQIKIAIMYIVPIGLAVLSIFYGNGFLETLIAVGGTASYIYNQLSRPNNDPIETLSSNVSDTFR